MKFDEFIHDNLKIILIAIAALFAVIVGAVALSVAYGGETTRNLTISEISGDVVIIRGEKQFYANKRTVLQSGDVINTAENGNVRVRIDSDKFISVEPNSAVYVFYTNVSDKGEVSVNIAGGAVTCQLKQHPSLHCRRRQTVSPTPMPATPTRGQKQLSQIRPQK